MYWALYASETSKTSKIVYFQLLLDNEIDLNVKFGDHDKNILHVACQEARLKDVEWVLSQNIIDINDTDKLNKTCLYCLIESNGASLAA